MKSVICSLGPWCAARPRCQLTGEAITMNDSQGHGTKALYSPKFTRSGCAVVVALVQSPAEADALFVCEVPAGLKCV